MEREEGGGEREGGGGGMEWWRHQPWQIMTAITRQSRAGFFVWSSEISLAMTRRFFKIVWFGVVICFCRAGRPLIVIEPAHSLSLSLSLSLIANKNNNSKKYSKKKERNHVDYFSCPGTSANIRPSGCFGLFFFFENRKRQLICWSAAAAAKQRKRMEPGSWRRCRQER